MASFYGIHWVTFLQSTTKEVLSMGLSIYLFFLKIQNVLILESYKWAWNSYGFNKLKKLYIRILPVGNVLLLHSQLKEQDKTFEDWILEGTT